MIPQIKKIRYAKDLTKNCADAFGRATSDPYLLRFNPSNGWFSGTKITIQPPFHYLTLPMAKYYCRQK